MAIFFPLTFSWNIYSAKSFLLSSTLYQTQGDYQKKKLFDFNIILWIPPPSPEGTASSSPSWNVGCTQQLSSKNFEYGKGKSKKSNLSLRHPLDTNAKLNGKYRWGSIHLLYDIKKSLLKFLGNHIMVIVLIFLIDTNAN